MIKSVSSVNLINKTITHKKKSYTFARDLINNSGVFLQEDISRVKSIQAKYSNLSKEEIKNKLSELTISINNLLQNFFFETQSVLNCLIYNDSQIASREICKKLKCDGVQAIGKKIVLYKKSSKKPVIELP